MINTFYFITTFLLKYLPNQFLGMHANQNIEIDIKIETETQIGFKLPINMTIMDWKNTYKLSFPSSLQNTFHNSFYKRSVQHYL